MALLEENFAISKELEDKPGIAASLTQLGNTVLHLGDHGRVEALREEGEALRRELADRRAIARLLLFLGQAALERDGYERAVALLEESLALFRELGDMRGTGMCLCSLGLTALEQGDSERAANWRRAGSRAARRTIGPSGRSHPPGAGSRGPHNKGTHQPSDRRRTRALRAYGHYPCP